MSPPLLHDLVLMAAVGSAGASALGLGRWLWDARQRRAAAARAVGQSAIARRAWGPELRAWSIEAAQKRLPLAWQQRAGVQLEQLGQPRERAAELLLASLALGATAWTFALALGAGSLSLLFLGLGALPWLRLRDAFALRRRRLLKALPEALDLLCACVQAGLGLDPALQRVAAGMPAGPLRQELERALDELRLGRPRREAFARLEARVGLRELGAVLRSVLRSEARGVPLAPVLAAQAAQLRRLRSLAVQKAAAQAPVKMLLPLMGFILPVVFLVVFGPIFLKLSELGF